MNSENLEIDMSTGMANEDRPNEIDIFAVMTNSKWILIMIIVLMIIVFMLMITFLYQ
jgi:LPS O-antigen subunit length determinant protein (WzzB/FepE family)